MSPELRDEIEIELGHIRRLLGDHDELIDLLHAREPSAWERSAVAALLHAFYNGAEGCFRRIAKGIDGSVPKTGDWHAVLLKQMEAGTATRPAVLNRELAEKLDEYMRFRHLFRHAYPFDLRWDRMAPLVEGLRAVAADFDVQIRSFVDSCP